MGWQDRAYHRDDTGGIPPVRFQFPPLTRLTIVLLSVNFAFFLFKLSPGADEAIREMLALSFRGNEKWQLWRWISYQYLHAGAGHLFFNMLGLYFFLPSLETRWGWQKAYAFYTLGGIVSGITFFLLIAATGRWGGGLIGASGSILACLGAVALFYPDRQLIFFLFSIPIRVAAALLGALYLLTVIAERDLSNAAHLGGLAFGFFAPWLAGPMLDKHRRNFVKWRDTREARAELDEQREVDRILAKVAEQGMQSLTIAEKRRLAQATANQQKRDAQRSRRVR